MKVKFEKPKMTVTLTFETSADWRPDSPGCVTECPFTGLINWGEECNCRTNNGVVCPFLKAEEIKG